MFQTYVKGSILLLGCWMLNAWGEVTVQVVDEQSQPMVDAVVMLKSDHIVHAVHPLEGIEVAQQAREFVPGVVVVTPGTAVVNR